MNERIYQMNEARMLTKQLQAIDLAPLEDRKIAAADWLQALSNPDLVAERVGWLLAGNYGYGAYVRAVDIARGSKRNNKAAQLGVLIAALEWSCASDHARAAWHKITPEQQNAVNTAIQAEIESWLADPENEGIGIDGNY